MVKLSQDKIRQFLAKGDNAQTTTEKGRALEDVICYIFEKIPDISCTARNQTDVFHSEEIDIAFFNEQSGVLKFLPNIIFVECKNWSKPLGSDGVRVFDSKLRESGLEFGLLVAANGVSGDKEEYMSACHVMKGALKEKRQIIVLTRQDIEAFTDTDDVVRTIKQRLINLYVRGNAW